MIHVIATISAQPGRRDELLAEFHKLVPQVRAESGCIEYGPAIDIDAGIDAREPVGEDAFLVIEKWESPAHLRAHLAAPHMLEYREKVKDLLAGVRIHVLQDAEAKSG